jgi:hypothetical protein
MKPRLLSLLTWLTLLLGSTATVQAQTPSWQTALASTNAANGTFTPKATAADASGNVYVTGLFSGQVMLGSTMLSSRGSNDVFVAKWDGNAGNWSWALAGGGNSSDQANGVAVDGSSVYVTGSFFNTSGNANLVSFGSTLNGVSSTAATDAFVAKITDAGSSASWSWALAGGGSNNDQANGVAVSGGGVYVTGSFINTSLNANSVSFGTVLNGTSSGPSIDAFVAKVADGGSAGSWVWALAGGGTTTDQGNAIAVNGSEVYVAGSFVNNSANGNAVKFGTTLNGMNGTASTDVFVAKVTDGGSAGAWTWALAGGGNSFDQPLGLALNGSSVYVTGTFFNNSSNANSVSFGSTLNGLAALASTDAFVAKATDGGGSGSWTWALAGGGSNTDQLNAVAVSGTSVYAVGQFFNSSANANAVSFGSPVLGLNGAATTEALITKITDAGSSGSWTWAQVGGGNGADQLNAVTVASGAVYAAGIMASYTGSYGAATNSPLSTGTTNSNLMMARLGDAGSSGSWQLVQQGYLGGAITGRSTAPDGQGNVYVAGSFTGQVMLGSTALNSRGGTEAFVAKWNLATSSWSWALAGGGSNNDQANGVAVNGSSVYVTGSFTNNNGNGNGVNFGAVLNGASVAVSSDVFVAKVSDAGSSGSWTWALAGGGNNTDQAYSVAVNGGSVYVAGSFINNSSNGSAVSFGSALNGRSAANTTDAFVAKVTDNGGTGVWTWALAGGGSSSDQANGVAVNGGSVYVTGSFTNNNGNSNGVNFGSILNGLSAGNTTDAFVAKVTDSGGTGAWTWALAGGGTGVDQAFGAAVNGSSVYVTGNFFNNSSNGSAVSFGSSLNGATTSSTTDAFVAKVTDAGSTGAWTWALAGGGTNTDQANAVAVNGSSVYITGYFVNTNANGNLVSFGSALNGLAAAGSTDAFVAKVTDLGSSGSWTWALAGGGAGFDQALGVAVDGSKVYTTGSLGGLPASFSSTTLSSPVSLSAGFAAALNDVPAILSFAPNPGGRGQAVTLTGTSLSGSTALLVNGATATASLNNNTATSVSFRVPLTATASGTTTLTAGGISTSSAAFTLMSAPGNALAFDGSDDELSVPHAAAFNITTAITIEAWVRTTYTGEQYITTKANDSWYLALEGGAGGNGRASFFLNNVSASGGGWLYGSRNLADGRWHHVAGTYNGSTLSLYVDGVLENSRAATGTIPTGGSAVQIGSRSGNRWQGSLDELRIYNVALSPAQLLADLSSTAAALPANLVLHYNFDQGTPGGSNAGLSTLYDLASGHVATLNGFSLSGPGSNWVESYAMVWPTTLAATAVGGGTFSANWTTPALGTVTSYLVDVATDNTFASPVSNSPFTAAAGTNSQVITGLPGGTTYYYRVRADKTAVTGQGASSAAMSVVVPVGSLSCVADAGNPTPYTYSLTSQSASTGPAGTFVTLTGTGLLSTTAVTFNGKAAAFSIVDNLSITATVPNGIATATGLISVTSPCGTVNAPSQFTLQFNLSSTNPGVNALAAPVASSAVALSFSEPVSSASAANVAVFGSLGGGRKAGSVSGGGSSSLSFAATASTAVTDFRPGEVVSVTVPATVLSTGGLAVAPKVYQFTSGGITPSTGVFTSRLDVGIGSSPRFPRWVDVDGDGKPDLITGNQGTSSLSVARNTSTLGSLSFNGGTTYTVQAPSQPYSIAAGDADGDGKPDLATANAQTGYVSVVRNISTPGTISLGSLSSFALSVTPGNPRSIIWGDFDADGKQDITAANSVTNSVSIIRNISSGVGNVNFATAVEVALTAGTGPRDMTAGDLDGDGKLDIVAANSAVNSLSVLRNTSPGAGSISFANSLDVALMGNSYPSGVALGDLDGDGKLDLVTLSINNNYVVVALNTSTPGAISFAPVAYISTGANTRPVFVTVADLNGDGKQDVATENGTSNSVGVLFNASTGVGNIAFSAAAQYALPASSNNSGISAADADGDGRLDLAAGNSGLNSVSVFLNQPPVPTIVSFVPNSAAAGSSVTLTGTNLGGATLSVNGRPASISANTGSTITFTVPSGATASGNSTVTTTGGTSPANNTFTVLLQAASTSPAANARTAAAVGPVAVSFTEPVTTASAAGISIFSGQYKGRRTATTSVLSSTASRSLSGGSFRAGELINVTVPATVATATGIGNEKKAYQFTTAVSGLGRGNFTPQPDLSSLSGARQSAVADFNNDGNPDLAIVNQSAGTVSIRMGSGTGTFTGSLDLPTGSNPWAVVTGDFNNDGNLDFAATNYTSDNVSIRLGAGDGSFSSPAVAEVTGMTRPTGLAVGDVNADGNLDLVTANYYYSEVSVLLGNGSGAFSVNTFGGMGCTPEGVALGDLNRDGRLDLLVANNSCSQVTAALGDGAGGFTATATVAVGSYPNGICTADFNNDNILDLAVANNGATYVSVALGTGSGSFGAASNVAIGNSPYGVTAGDVNADGNLDLLVANSGSASASVRLGTGSGTFSGSLNLTAGATCTGVSLADLDSDGDLDLLAANKGSNTLSVFLNQQLAPTITGISPMSGPIGRVVTVTGTNFTGTTAVAFNGTAASSYTLVSATSLTATVAAGTTTGTVSVTTPGGPATSAQTFTVLPAAGALSFDGSDDYVNVNYSLNTLPLTLEAWVKPTAVGGRYYVISNDQPTLYGAGFGINNGVLEIDIHNAFLTVNSATFTANTWTHIAVVYEASGNVRAYRNGVEVYNNIPNPTWTSSVNGLSNFMLGKCNPSVPLPFPGVIDEVRVWNRAVSGCELAEHYGCELSGTEPGLGVYLNFNNGTAGVGGDNAGLTTATDLSAPAVNGTLTNFGLSSATSNWTTQASTVGSSCAPFVDDAPTAVAQSLSVTLNAAGTATITAASVNNGSADDCGAVTLSVLPNTFGCANLGANTVTLTVTDNAGNSSMATATVTVSQPVLATATWTGAYDSNLLDCRNWSYGKLPDATTHAMLPTGLGRYPVLSAGTMSVANLTIASGASLSTTTGTSLQVYGDWLNSGSSTLGGPVSFVGSASQQLGGSATTSFATLEVNKAGGTLQLQRDVPVSTALVLSSGTLTTSHGYRIQLGATASLSETETSYVVGIVETTRLLNAAGVSTDFGGLGVTLTPTGLVLPGSTLVRRETGLPLSGVFGNQGIARYFDIVPTVDVNLNVAMSMSYFEHELNGISEGNLALYKSVNGTAGPWARQTSAVRNTATNTMALTGISSFSTWTLGSLSAPLPVELLEFTAARQGADVQLSWHTASEQNSERFEVERSADGRSFERITTVAAQGSSTSPTAYSYLDHSPIHPFTHSLFYRLRQVDTDGSASYSPVRAVTFPHSAIQPFTLYPNPAHDAVTVTGLQAGQLIEVFDALGRALLTATADASGSARLVLPTGLAAGVYLVRSGSQVQRLTVE